jgi:hypothetical protein
MKTHLIIPIFILTGCLNATIAADSEVELFTHPNNGGLETNVWIVPLATLDIAPKWKMGEGEPPLSVGKAITLARKWLISKGCDTNAWVAELTIRPVAPQSQKYQRICYYNILFGGVGFFGHFKRCIVLMDGTIVEPQWLKGYPKDLRNNAVYDE